MKYKQYIRSDMWRDLREKRLKMDAYQCTRCFSTTNLQVHHRKYPDSWHKDNTANLQTLCQSCHLSKHGRHCAPEYRRPFVHISEVLPRVLAQMGMAV